MLRSIQLARLEVDWQEKEAAEYNGRVDPRVDADDDGRAVWKEPWRHHGLRSRKTAALRPCKETEACESDEQRHERVPRAPTVAGTCVCESVQHGYSGSNYDAVTNEVNTLYLLLKRRLSIPVDAQENEECHEGYSTNRQIHVENPTPGCDGNDGTPNKGAEGCSHAIDG